VKCITLPLCSLICPLRRRRPTPWVDRNKHSRDETFPTLRLASEEKGNKKSPRISFTTRGNGSSSPKLTSKQNLPTCTCGKHDTLFINGKPDGHGGVFYECRNVSVALCLWRSAVGRVAQPIQSLVDLAAEI
jgi:hypothetical protein